VSDHLDLSDPAIGALIRCKAAKLAKLAKTTTSGRSERDDLAQDLWVTVLSRWKQFDPNRGDPGAFLHVVLKNAVANILRNLLAEKRSRPGPPESPEGCPDPQQADKEALRDLVIDVQEALKAMPEGPRVIADRIGNSDTIAEAARDLGLPRPTLYSRLDAIRRRFECRGLEGYLKK